MPKFKFTFKVTTEVEETHQTSGTYDEALAEALDMFKREHKGDVVTPSVELVKAEEYG